MPAPTIRCPHCLESIDLTQHLREEGWRRLMLTLGGMGPAWRLALDYLLLFRVGPGRVPMRAMQRAATELVDVVRRGRLEFDRRSYRVERHQLEAALARVVDRPPQEWPGLRNNNYLWRVLEPMLSQARRAEAAREQAREESRRWGEHRRRPDRPDPAPPAEASAGRPIWDGPPEQVVVALARAYRSPATLAGLPETVGRLEQALARAGADLDRLREVAAGLPRGYDREPGLGRRLLAQCRRTEGDGPTPVGECLPAPVQAPDPDLDEAEVERLAGLARELGAAYRAEAARLRGQAGDRDVDPERRDQLEQAAHQAGLDTRELARLAHRGALEGLSDRALAERLLATGG